MLVYEAVESDTITYSVMYARITCNIYRTICAELDKLPKWFEKHWILEDVYFWS